MRCAYCDKIMAGRRHPTRDHVVPRSRGGVESIRNFAIVCQICNQDKDDLLLSEWLDELRRQKDERVSVVAKFAADFASFGTLMNAVRPGRRPMTERVCDISIPAPSVVPRLRGRVADIRIVPGYLVENYREMGYVIDEGAQTVGDAKMMRRYA